MHILYIICIYVYIYIHTSVRVDVRGLQWDGQGVRQLLAPHELHIKNEASARPARTLGQRVAQKPEGSKSLEKTIKVVYV